MGIRIFGWCRLGLARQRRYFSEMTRSRLRGIRACLMTAPAELLALERGDSEGEHLLAHCQVGFAVTFIIE